jgi:hypothetical protein
MAVVCIRLQQLRDNQVQADGGVTALCQCSLLCNTALGYVLCYNNYLLPFSVSGQVKTFKYVTPK